MDNFKEVFKDGSSTTAYVITIIGGNKYCLEFGTDGNGNVSNWYLNNWPEGDIIDYYDSLEQ